MFLFLKAGCKMSVGSAKLKPEGKPLITVGLPGDVDVELAPSAFSLAPSLGEMRW